MAQTSTNLSLAGLMNGKQKASVNNKQMASPGGSLTTARSLEMTKAEFVENTFESSDEEDIPNILDSSVCESFVSDF